MRFMDTKTAIGVFVEAQRLAEDKELQEVAEVPTQCGCALNYFKTSLQHLAIHQ